MSRTVVRALQGIGLVLLTVAGIVWLSGGFGTRISPDDIEPARAVIPAGAVKTRVERVTEPAVEWASGALRSASRTAISARILARIEQLKVAAGDRVEAGDVLVVLDARDLEARVEQARHALDAAKAKLELAETEKERAAGLLERGVGTQQRYDRALSGLRVAKAEVDRAGRTLEEARTALSYAVIKAPVGGRVVDRLAEPGDMAAPGAPLLRVYDPARLRVEAPVRESLAVRLSVGQRLSVHVAAVEARLEGVIGEIVPFAEPGARTLLVKVALPAKDGLFAGLFARIGVPAGERTRLYVPVAAVERIGQLAFVTVVGDDGKPSRRLITTGQPRSAERIEVLSGIKEGEMVLVGS